MNLQNVQECNSLISKLIPHLETGSVIYIYIIINLLSDTTTGGFTTGSNGHVQRDCFICSKFDRVSIFKMHEYCINILRCGPATGIVVESRNSLSYYYSENTLLVTTWNRDKNSDQDANSHLVQLKKLFVKLGFIIEIRVHGN